MSQTTDISVNCLRTEGPRLPKAYLAVEYAKNGNPIFNGHLYWYLITIKLNIKPINGGIASPAMYKQIFDLYKDFGKVKNTFIQCYELDTDFQLHFHAVVCSHKKSSQISFVKKMRREIATSQSIHFYISDILTQQHLDYCLNVYCKKEDQNTVIERYNNLILDMNSVLPNEDPDEPEQNEPDEPIPSNFIVDFID